MSLGCGVHFPVWDDPDAAAAWHLQAGQSQRDQFGGLRAGHAYTVLGRNESAGSSYVVLRDPHGRDLAPPMWLDAPAWSAQFADGRTVDVPLNQDGVFGLHIEDFARSFGALGWART